MRTMFRQFSLLCVALMMTTSVYAHPGHNHAQLSLSELFVHMLVWGGVLAMLGTGVWLLMRVGRRLSNPQRCKVKKE